MTLPYEPDFSGRRPRPPQRIASSRRGMVSSQQGDATKAGVEILAKGGNAFDAAVAVQLALAVCEPAASGLGGQTMVLLHEASSGRTVALDGSSRAPNRASPQAIPKEGRHLGYRATTVPSTPAVLGHVLERHGSLSRADVMEPALRLAEDGYEISALQHILLRRKLDALRHGTAAELFLKGGREPYTEGDVFCQPVLAGTLHRLAVHGFADFYTGEVGRAIVVDMAEHDGLVGAHDLHQVPWPVEREPEWGRFDRRRTATFPPAGAGRVLLQFLHVYDCAPKRLRDMDTPEGAVFLARNVRQALADHREEPRDPARHHQSPHAMIDRPRAKKLAWSLRADLHGDTTHLSVMDEEGNAVGFTSSIETLYGACVATPGLGFLYNNYISAFEHDDPAHPYALRPNAVPWSSVAPTIVFRHRRPVLVLGSPGSDRIASAVGQVMVRLAGGEDAYEAVEAPRLHATPDGAVLIEGARMRDDIPAALEADGFQPVLRDPYSYYLGCVQLVKRTGRRFIGVADPRRDGTAEGPP